MPLFRVGTGCIKIENGELRMENSVRMDRKEPLLGRVAVRSDTDAGVRALHVSDLDLSSALYYGSRHTLTWRSLTRYGRRRCGKNGHIVAQTAIITA